MRLCVSTGEEWPVYDDLSKDQQETWAVFGVYPNFNWTPDSKNIIFNLDYKLLGKPMPIVNNINLDNSFYNSNNIDRLNKFRILPKPTPLSTYYKWLALLYLDTSNSLS